MAAAVDSRAPLGHQQAELMRRYTAFLDADNGRGPLATRIQSMISPPDEETLREDQFPKRLIVPVDDLRVFDAQLAIELITRPVEHLPFFERAMHDLIMGLRADLAMDKRRLADYRIGLDGAFGARHVSPRGLNARLVGGLVKVDGIVTRASVVRPRLVLSVHYCPTTRKFHEKTFRDNASVSSLAVFTQNAGMPGSSYPTKDEDGNPLETEFGRCWYRDSQRITIQEMPESSPPGQLPRSIDVLIESDLCDVCKPGDRVSITGIFRAVGGAVSSAGSGLFTTFVVANHISLLSGAEGRTTVDNSIHEDDIHNFIQFASRGNVLPRMARSIAPSICGHEYIKRALLLQLIGGRERNLENGTHLRGDLNILMVGDPSTAKSQLLRFVMNTAPLAVSTTGRGSSGVGLTAAVTSDQDTGDRHLEAGAMVLADRGVVCIDEFDKMSDEDRVAIHEVMEQQTVTIAKAGIHASLNARCSVVAAANPVYGSYDKRRKPHENIALPDSLLSRFDLLFIVLDVADKERDRQIAEHVLRGHRFRRAADTLDNNADESSRGRVSASVRDDSAEAAAGETSPTPMYETAASALYRHEGGRRRSARRAGDSNKILSTAFLKRFISYAKHRVNPTLTREAAELISSVYQRLRQDEEAKTQHITARCLETLIRLATAHAKLRLDKAHVLREDAQVAAELLRFALFNQAEPDLSEQVFRKRDRKARRAAGDKLDDDDNDDGGDGDGDGDGSADIGANATGASGTVDIEEGMGTEETDEITPAPSNSRPRRSGRSRSGSAAVGTGSGDRDMLPESAEAEGGSMDVTNEPTEAEAGPSRSSRRGGGAGSSSNGGRNVERVKMGLNKLRGREGTVQVAEVVEFASVSGDGYNAMSSAEVTAALEELQRQDVVVIADGEIFIV